MFLLSCVGLAAVGTGAVLFGGGMFTDGSAEGQKQPYSRRGTLAWALEMRDRPDSDLLSAAGDLERVSMNHRNAAALIEVFERLLDLALVSNDEHADVAGSCAIRSLARLGRPDIARRQGAEITGSGRLPLMVEALQGLARRRSGGR